MSYRNKEDLKAYLRKHYLENKPKYQKSKQRARRRNKAYIDKFKRSHGCQLCSESEVCALDCHHISDKDATLNQAITDRWSIERINAELKKCIVLCSNCHRKLHAGLL
jgi:hypothetical protein